MLDSEVVAFRAQFESRSMLDEIVQEGAQKMLQAAIEAEVDEFLGACRSLWRGRSTACGSQRSPSFPGDRDPCRPAGSRPATRP